MHRPTEQDIEASNGGQRTTVDAVVDILEAFDGGHRLQTVRELARRSGVPRSTTHRIVRQLLARRMLESTPRGRIQVGVRMFELGTLAPTHSTIREAALPFAHHLREFTRLTVNVAVREGADVVYLEKLSVPRTRVPHTRQGGRASMHTTALGKAMLAFRPLAEIDEYVSRPLRAATTHTITDPGALRRELELARQRRVAFDLEESGEGLFCVASPILDSAGFSVAAISVTGATLQSQVEEHSGAVRTAALAISRSIGSLVDG
jgi:IclR family acetate operon transcriptional repressor